MNPQNRKCSIPPGVRYLAMHPETGGWSILNPYRVKPRGGGFTVRRYYTIISVNMIILVIEMRLDNGKKKARCRA